MVCDPDQVRICLSTLSKRGDRRRVLIVRYVVFEIFVISLKSIKDVREHAQQLSNMGTHLAFIRLRRSCSDLGFKDVVRGYCSRLTRI